jgi:ATP-dependent DNA helicase RecQ
MLPPLHILQQYWGHSQFRPGQQDIVEAILEGNDVLALLPTGGGKSVCFQVPAMAMPGICLVVSPLIALMKDQVENLKKKDIGALAIYSGMSFIETRKTLENAAYGNYKFLYVSPERLETSLFLEYLPALKINLVAVDEAHCVSQWGYDFRPPYLRIAALREHLPGIPIAALTASATTEVQQDICDKLQFTPRQKIFQQSFERANLSYSAFNVEGRQNKLLDILKNVKGSAIVYCKTRKHTKEVADMLKTHGHNADFYHAGLGNDLRSGKQEAWISNRIRIMACTNAFGMGIDKPDVRVVVHYDVPDCIENYYQEAGRAGRDGKRAYAVLLYNNRELVDIKEQAATRFPDEDTIKTVYKALMNHLQVAANSGEGLAFNFDIGVFARAFKLNILTATYAIKALEQEELLSFNEVFFKPATLVFTVSKPNLLEFEKSYPHLEPTVKGVLRSYEGVFDFPATINESKLADFLKKEEGALKNELLELHRYGIVEYSPQKDKPQLTLLQNRTHTDDFRFNSPAYFKRKVLFEKRAGAITAFATDTAKCRSQAIAVYFGSPPVKACGVCDNCINQKALTISQEEFDRIAAHITEGAAEGTTINGMLALAGKTGREKFWKVINFLLAEEKISISADGSVKSS